MILAQTFAQHTDIRQKEIENVIATSLAVPLVERDSATLQDTLDAFYAHGGIDYLLLLDSRGRSMASVNWSSDTIPATSQGLPGQNNAPVWDAVADIHLGGQVYGYLYYGLSTTPLIMARETMQRSALLIFALAMVGSTVLFSAIGFWLTHRLRHFVTAAEAIASENPSARVPVGKGGDEIDRMGQNFNAMAEALESKILELSANDRELRRSNEDLKQFAYLASHDLQTPLRTIASYVQLLERRYADQLDDDGKAFIQYAADGSKRMSVLLQSILDYSLIDTAPLKQAEVPMDAVWATTLKNLDAAIRSSGATVELTTALPTVKGIETQIGQILQNLLENAIKYREADRAPKVFFGAEKDGNFWRFDMIDNGLGIDESYIDKIFTIFQRLHTVEEYEGTGIGLAFCKKVVERHGGRIWASSQGPGKGSAFHFTLPAAAKDHPTNEKAPG